VRGRKRRLSISLFCALPVSAFVAASASCREPTQVELVVNTRVLCSELTSAAIAVASTPARAEADFAVNENIIEASNCRRGSFGSLIITQGSARGAVLVVAGLVDELGGSDVRLCTPPSYRGCIVARRNFPFSEGTTLRIPITLESSCVGVVCDNPLQTCIAGVCVSSDGTVDGLPPIAESDGGFDAARSEAGPPSDAAVLACPSPASPCDAVVCTSGSVCCRNAIDATARCRASCSADEILSCCNAGCPTVGEYCSAAPGGPFVCSPELSATRAYVCSPLAPSCPQGMGHDTCFVSPSAGQGYCK